MSEESKGVLSLEATEERMQIVRETIGRIATYIKGRKLDEGTFTKDATAGFNLACDFLSHELFKMQEFNNKDILE